MLVEAAELEALLRRIIVHFNESLRRAVVLARLTDDVSMRYRCIKALSVALEAENELPVRPLRAFLEFMT